MKTVPSVEQYQDGQRQALRRALSGSDLTTGDLWWRFFALGGLAGLDEVEGFLAGAPLAGSQANLLALAANERLAEWVAGVQVPSDEQPVRSSRPSAGIAVALEGSRRAVGGGFGAVARQAGLALGVQVVTYLVDDEQRSLVPFDPPPGERARRPLSLESTLPGRAFRRGRTETARTGPSPRWWIPLWDGAQRLGVLDVRVPHRHHLNDPLLRRECELLAALLGRLTTASARVGDAVHATRRSPSRTIAADLIWSLLPPLTADDGTFTISGLVEPADEVGGDVFDYALSRHHVDLAVFDAMGHSLEAGLMASATLAAYRNARRSRRGLVEQATAIDDVVAEHFPDGLVTGVLLHLDRPTGLLRYVGAGHPAPLVLRDGHVVLELDGGRRTPFGVATDGFTVGEAHLQPGDWIVLHTDGIDEARDEQGQFFGRQRLVDFLERTALAGLDPAETVRRLVQAILRHQDQVLQDDATVLVARWRGPRGSGAGR